MRKRAILLLVAMVGALIVGSGVALAATFTCAANPCLGTPDPDVITGTNNPEEIRALAGNDRVSGGYGDDTIYGDEGNDLVTASLGDDTVYGGPDGDGSALGTSFGQNNLEGEYDSDAVYGGGGSDYIDAAFLDIPLQYIDTEPVDHSYGQGGSDHIYAVDGNVDIIDCGKGRRDVAFIDRGRIDTTTGCEMVFKERAATA